jgi:hypothetical protein
VLALSVAVVSCSKGDRTATLTSECMSEIGGVSYFLGDEHCYRLFPIREMSGFWVSGHEYSSFYRNRSSVPEGFDPAAVWLSLSHDAYTAAEPFLDGTWRIFQVSFRGTEPGIDGIYGHQGMSKRGVFVDRFLTLKEVQ